MTATEFIHAELRRLHKALDSSLDGLTAEQLHMVPGGPGTANTIAWVVWHVVRTEDSIVRFVCQNRRAPVWNEGGYAEKLALPPTAQGTGMSTADAQALRMKDVPLFREYMQKVWASTDDFFATTDPATLDRVITVRPLGDMPVLRAIGQICGSHGFMHFGELELARTLVGAKPVSGT